MTFAVRIDSSNPTPPYEQLRRQISDAISSGALLAGSQLPTVRQLAGDLGVATGTVMRAYAALESDHLVRTARGAGTTVAAAHTLSADDQQARLVALSKRFVADARLFGATDAQIMAAVQSNVGQSQSQIRERLQTEKLDESSSDFVPVPA